MYGDGSLTETKTKKKNGTEYHYWVVRYYDNEGHRKAKRFPHTEQGKRDAKGFLRSIAQKKKDGVLVANTRTVAGWKNTSAHIKRRGCVIVLLKE